MAIYNPAGVNVGRMRGYTPPQSVLDEEARAEEEALRNRARDRQANIFMRQNRHRGEAGNWSWGPSGDPVWHPAKPFMTNNAAMAGLVPPAQQPIGIAANSTMPPPVTPVAPVQQLPQVPVQQPRTATPFTGARAEVPYWMKKGRASYGG